MPFKSASTPVVPAVFRRSTRQFKTQINVGAHDGLRVLKNRCRLRQRINAREVQKENERQGKGDVGHPTEGAEHDGAAEHLPFVLNVVASYVLNLADTERKAQESQKPTKRAIIR